MQSKEKKQFDDRLRRNIWRSLLIMRSATVQELLGVVTGLTIRNAKRLLRDMETHSYLKREGRARPSYAHAIHSPSLPSVCAHCGRSFGAKACSPAGKKKEKETERQTETQKQRKTKRRLRRDSSTWRADRSPDVPTKPESEVKHDPA